MLIIRDNANPNKGHFARILLRSPPLWTHDSGFFIQNNVRMGLFFQEICQIVQHKIIIYLNAVDGNTQ